MTSTKKLKSVNLSASISRIDPGDRTVEGLRIPSSLDSQLAVNFVLTQEPGKLKPKDLKIAIEKNRLEREARAEEQRKLRDEGGGAGVLDLRGILAEERLNYTTGDAFRRQLREIAFLGDVEEVEKAEAEKVFRVSEDCLGAAMLSAADLEVIRTQRTLAMQTALRGKWRGTLGRQQTILHPPTGSLRAGTSQGVTEDLLTAVSPSYDPNANDVWAKRMNTLRRLISCVSKYIVQQRVMRRLRSLRKYFTDHQAFTREEVKAFIELDNADQAMRGNTEKKVVPLPGPAIPEAGREMTYTDRIFSRPLEALVLRMRDEQIITSAQRAVHLEGKAEYTAQMAARFLYPVFDRSARTSSRTLVPTATILNELLTFDDRTFKHTLITPAHRTRDYVPCAVPVQQLYFANESKDTPFLAPEEAFLRPMVDLPAEKTLQFAGPSPEELSALRKESMQLTDWMTAPNWLTAPAIQHSVSERDFSARPAYRAYQPLAPYAEHEPAYLSRPTDVPAVYKEVPSMRSQWKAQGAFQAADIYLNEPTLIDFYHPDHDRHVSGLHCYAKDHERDVLGWDKDIRPVQAALDPLDHLTDSESDDDTYVVPKPTMAAVRALLSTPVVKEEVKEDKKNAKKGAPPPAAAKPAAAAPVPAVVAPVEEDGLADHERREEQVELLRDRKTLELAGQISKQTKAAREAAHARYAAIAAKGHPLFAAPVSVPFHMYEAEVYKHMGQFVPERSQVLMELPPGPLVNPLSMSTTSLKEG